MGDCAKIVCGERERSRAGIERRSLQAAVKLRTLGVGEGGCVALLRNGFAFCEASFAVTALGAYAVPMNWHLAAPEIACVREDSAARVLVAHADLLRAAPQALDAARRLDVTVLQIETLAADSTRSASSRGCTDDWPVTRCRASSSSATTCRARIPARSTRASCANPAGPVTAAASEPYERVHPPSPRRNA